MSAKKIGTTYAELTVKDKMTMGIKKATKSLTTMAKVSSRAFGVFAAGSGVALAAGSKAAIGMVAQIEELSQQSGIGVAALMNLQQAYKDGGRDASMATKDISKMQKAIADVASGVKKDDPFKEMGLSAQELIGMNPDMAFQRIGAAIMSIENPTIRNAKAMEIFGKSGSQLVTVFGELEGGQNRLGKMPEIAQRFAGAMGEADDIMGRLSGKKDQFLVGFSSGIIGELLPALKTVDGFDFTQMGVNIGQNIAFGFKGLMDGTFLKIAALKVTAFIAEIGVTIANVFDSVMTDLTSLIGAAFETILNKTKNIWTDIRAGFGDESAMRMQTQSIVSGQRDRTFTESFLDRNKKSPFKPQFIEDMKTASDDLWNNLNKSFDKNIKAVENLSQPMRRAGEDLQTLTPKQEAASFETAQSTVNEMQSRGLGMGREGVANQVKTQSKILEQIRDLIKAQGKMQPISVF